jgi:hypothetical protein
LTSLSTVNTQLSLSLTSYESPRSFTKDSLDRDLDLSATCRIWLLHVGFALRLRAV